MSGSHAPRVVAAVVLAAGAGSRLRPLTAARPKALCPVGGVPLVDQALERARAVTPAVAVNVHAGREQMVARLEREPDVHVSIEAEGALGTAGALGALRPWIDGRPALVQNADAWCDADLTGFVDTWDGRSVRLLLAGDAGFHPRAKVVASLLPWSVVRLLDAVPTGLYETCWRGAHERGELEAVAHRGTFVDCGTVADYLRANLGEVARRTEAGPAEHRSIIDPDAVVTGRAVQSVVGAGAAVLGCVTRSVVWDGCEVAPGEHLVDAVRFDGGRTVLVRR